MSIPPWIWKTEPFVIGLFVFWTGAVVGSFLNVVIWRLPRRKPGQGLLNLLNVPSSHCPKCGIAIRPVDNVPLVSIVALRARCRSCRARFSWRYFWVELLTALLFVALYLHFGTLAEAAAYGAFAAALIAAAAIDLEMFIIPDELNTFALAVGFGYDAWGIATGAPGHDPLFGWLPRSLAGALICAGIFVLIQMMGAALFKKEAMGDGDVKLARAIGAMLPISLALVSFLLAIAVGAILGGAMLLFQRGAQDDSAGPETAEDETDQGEPVSLAQILGQGALYLAFADVFVSLLATARVGWARRLAEPPADSDLEEDDFAAGPTHIPFGPYMVLGAFLSIFFGQRLIAWYLAWAHLSA